MKKNWKYGNIFGLLALLLLFFAACNNGSADHSQHGGNAAAYQCPMKCEGDKTYPQPGSCPVCKMDLKPVEMPAGHDHSAMQNDTAAAVYTCPMHPEIVRGEPGTCPICKMDLVKKETSASSDNDHGSHAAPSADLDFLLKPTYEYVLTSVKTARPERKTLAASIEAPGYLAYDARKVQAISARFGGRIERLYVKYLYQPVRKGQRILDIYSPEIATAQQDLIFLLENDADNKALIENARRRLSLLGMTAAQIGEVEKTRKPSLSLPVFSPYDGLVFEKAMPALALPGSEMGEGMENGGGAALPTSLAADGELSLREGMYVQKGQRLFSLQSLSTVWAVLEFYPSDVALVKVGQPVSVRIEPFDQQFSGKINYIEPQFGTGGKNLRARVYLDNPSGKLKPGALLKATVQASGRSAIWIPKTAALDLGRQRVVFLKKDGVFQSKKIVVGSMSGDWLEVRSGISENDEIAADAQFLMDSESFVKSN
jgi:Cu(I)/Ag(I) efflux system membrane fusion protein